MTRTVGALARGTEVAVKRLLDPSDNAARRALEREAELASSLQHPAIVQAHGFGEDEDGPWLALELLEGPDLGVLVEREGSLAEERVRRIGARLADALATLHELGYVHQDLKPANVLLNARGRATLIDFGLTVQEGVQLDEEPGSLAYFAPERLRGLSPDTASDVFSLGVLLYELATGQHPFAPPGASARATIAAIERARCDLPSRRIPRISPLLDELLNELLAVTPSERPRAREVAQRLRAGEGSAWWRRRSRESSGARWGIGEQLPLIGRANELEGLKRAWAHVVASNPEHPRSSVVLLTGSAGTGKARLAGEFCVHARRRGIPPRYLFARWTAAKGAQAAGALYAWFERWAERRPDGSIHPELAEELARSLSPRSARKLIEPDLVEGSGIPALVEWLVHLGREAPTILFLDDVHLAGLQTLDALFQLFGRLSGTRLFVILSARLEVAPQEPELFRKLVGLIDESEHDNELAAFATRIDLSDLSDESLEGWVDVLFHTTSPKLRIAQVLNQRAHGNPGLFRELVKSLVRRGLAAPFSSSDPRLVLTISPESIPEPPSLDRLLAERMEALGEAERRWLERASVVGGRITHEFLSRTFGPVASSELNRVLARLVEAEWLVPAGVRYRFRRPALREAIYRSLDSGRRRLLHLTAAAGLAEEGGQLELAYQRAFHLRAAGSWRDLVEACRELIPALRGRSSSRRLLTLARYGLEALERIQGTADLDTTRIEFLEVAADAALRLGLREEQRALLDDLTEVSGLDEDPELAARVYLLFGRYNVASGRFDVARQALERARDVARDAGQGDLEIQALSILGDVLAEFGDVEEARAALDQVLGSKLDTIDEAAAWLSVAKVEIMAQRSEAALLAVQRALELTRELERHKGDLAARAWMLSARVKRSLGLSFEALAAAKRAARIARKSGERRLEAEARARFGALLVDLNRPTDAEVQLRDALLISEEIDDQATRALASIWLGALLWENDDEHAAEPLERGRQLAAEVGYRRAEAVALSILARMALMSEDKNLERALGASQRALELVDAHGAEITDALTASGTRALVLDRAGRKREAETLIARETARIRRSVDSIESPRLKVSHARHLENLFALVRSTEGDVWPRRV